VNHLVKPPDRLYPRHRSNSRQAPLRPTAEAQTGAAGVAAGEDADAEVEAGARLRFLPLPRGEGEGSVTNP